MDLLLPSFRRQLRARAHSLHPVVSIGQHGLTDSVLHEIDVALAAHELIKVRVFNDDRRQRESMLGRIAHALDCAPIQQIGKLLVLWRPRARAEPEHGSQLERTRRQNARQPPAVARRRRGVGIQAVTSTGTPRATSGGKQRATPIGKPRVTPLGKPRGTPIGKPRATSAGNPRTSTASARPTPLGATRARTPGPPSSETRTPRKAGAAPAGVPRAAPRRRRRAP